MSKLIQFWSFTESVALRDRGRTQSSTWSCPILARYLSRNATSPESVALRDRGRTQNSTRSCPILALSLSRNATSPESVASRDRGRTQSSTRSSQVLALSPSCNAIRSRDRETGPELDYVRSPRVSFAMITVFNNNAPFDLFSDLSAVCWIS